MGKEEKEDSGFGFKDRAKAEETLRLLERHDPNYRRLTVRGLLGRARRVLSLTKAEDKIRNIKEAMEVFEGWLADLDEHKADKGKRGERKGGRGDGDGAAGDKSSDKSDEEMPEVEEKKKKESPPPDTVPGLGFKDKETAEQSLQVLEGRDPDYQKLAVRGLIGRAKRVLTCTRDDTKINNIKEAMAIFDRFLDDFETMHLSKQNNPYLPLGVVRRCREIAGEKGVGTERQEPKDDAVSVLRCACANESFFDQTTKGLKGIQKAFIAAYARVKGEYKRLRTVEEQDGGQTWDIVRNKELKPLKEKYADIKLFDEKNEPTNEHLEMLLWAYSPDAARAKKYIPESSGRENDERKSRSSAGDEPDERKRKSSGGDDSDERKRKSSGGDEKNERKRKSSGGDETNERKRKSSSGDESGERKRKHSDGNEDSERKRKSSGGGESSPKKLRE